MQCQVDGDVHVANVMSDGGVAQRSELVSQVDCKEDGDIFDGVGLRKRWKKAKDRFFRVGSWNARSLRMSVQVTDSVGQQLKVRGAAGDDKFVWMVEFMAARCLSILCLSEHHLSTVDCDVTQAMVECGSGYRIYFDKHVAMVLSPDAYDAFLDAGGKVQWFSERVMAMAFKFGDRFFWFASVYGPTFQRSLREREEFLETLVLVRRLRKRRVFILGDFNARLGHDSFFHDDDDESPCLGRHSTGVTNFNGGLLLEWLRSHGFVHIQSHFQHSRKGTWFHASSRYWYELDYALCPRSDLSCVSDAFVSFDAYDSDHRPTILTIRRRCESVRKRQKGKGDIHISSPQRKPNVSLLRNDVEAQRQFTSVFRETLKTTTRESVSTHSSVWSVFAESLHGTALEVCGSLRLRREAHPWVRQNEALVLRLVDKKRKAFILARAKKSCPKRRAYLKKVKRYVKTRLRKAMNEYWLETAQKVNTAYSEKDTFNVYKEISHIQEMKRSPKKVATIRHTNGDPVASKEECLARWSQHFQGILNVIPGIDESVVQDIKLRDVVPVLAVVPSLDEIKTAIYKLQNHKARGLDGVLAEMLKYGGDDIHVEIGYIIQHVWSTGEVPQEWKDCEIIALPKKGDLSLCDNWRGIALLSIGGKVFTNLLASRLEHIVSNVVQDEQNGFRRSRSTVDGIHVVRRMIEMHRTHDKPLHLAFVDLRKFYDTIPRNLLWKVLVQLGAPPKLVSLTRAVHDGAIGKVRVEGEHTPEFPITGGLRQGCTLAPCLAILYMAAAIEVWRGTLDPAKSTTIGYAESNVRLYRTDLGKHRAKGSRTVTDGEYADDLTLFAPTRTELKHMLTTFATVAARFGMTVAWPKTDAMCVADNPIQEDLQIDFNGQTQRVAYKDRFVFLGSVVTASGSMEEEIAYRSQKAAMMFSKLQDVVFRHKSITRNTKAAVYRAIYLNTILYSAEAWPKLTYAMYNKLERHQMHKLRIIHDTPLWLQRRRRISNERIRNDLNIRPIDDVLLERQSRWIARLWTMAPHFLVRRVMFGWPVGFKSTLPHQNYLFTDRARQVLDALGVREGQAQKRGLLDWARKKRWNPELLVVLKARAAWSMVIMTAPSSHARSATNRSSP